MQTLWVPESGKPRCAAPFLNTKVVEHCYLMSLFLFVCLLFNSHLFVLHCPRCLCLLGDKLSTISTRPCCWWELEDRYLQERKSFCFLSIWKHFYLGIDLKKIKKQKKIKATKCHTHLQQPPSLQYHSGAPTAWDTVHPVHPNLLCRLCIRLYISLCQPIPSPFPYYV